MAELANLADEARLECVASMESVEKGKVPKNKLKDLSTFVSANIRGECDYHRRFVALPRTPVNKLNVKQRAGYKRAAAKGEGVGRPR